MSEELRTNIKGLPEGRTYFTEIGYSQSYPWAEVRRTPSTVLVAKVHTRGDPDWKAEFDPGGFSAHCLNQQDQTWRFDHISEHHTIRLRKAKDGTWRWKRRKFVENVAIEFYDYNF